jgi:NDP-sugar pyrophosphorylase family protein
VEAIILAGGRAERLGAAAGGRPKPLVDVGGRPLVAYQLHHLARAGVTHAILACAAGQGPLFDELLGGLGIDVTAAEEPEPRGRGGGIRLAAATARREQGRVLALNGDELLDLDVGALLSCHAASGAPATIAVARPRSQFGVVELDGDRVTAFREGGRVPFWVSCGFYVLEQEALDRFPEVGDHEATTFPELAAAGRLAAYRHEGTWLTVNTPKELRAASEHLAAHPEWLA